MTLISSSAANRVGAAVQCPERGNVCKQTMAMTVCVSHGKRSFVLLPDQVLALPQESVAAEMRMAHVPCPPVSVVTGPPDVCHELRLKSKLTQ